MLLTTIVPPSFKTVTDSRYLAQVMMVLLTLIMYIKRAGNILKMMCVVCFPVLLFFALEKLALHSWLIYVP